MTYEISMFQNVLRRRHLLSILLSASLILLNTWSLQAHAGWQLQWLESFDGNGVNWGNWNAQTMANYNNEVQCYTDDDSSDEKNYDVSNGTLKIIARKKDIACPGLNGIQKSWTSGRLNSKDKQEFLYGRIESRIRFLNLEGGTWPAFWMLENRIAEDPIKNDNDFINWPNPGAGEIDVWEWFSNQPSTYITNFFNTNGCGSEALYAYPGGGPDVQQWHKYAIEWSEDKIEFFVNDILVRSHNVSSCPQYKEPMFVLLNVAMGGNLGGNIDSSLSEATLEIDYVAHCVATDSNDYAYCDESSINNPDIDEDGVLNEQDLCPDTESGAVVDEDGCGANQEANLAPEVSLSMSQNSQAITTIDPFNGNVTIYANVVDGNSADSHEATWDVDTLPSPYTGDLFVNFNPLLMDSGSYTVGVSVADNGTPSLMSTATLVFDLVANQAPTAVISGPTAAVSEGESISLSAAESSDPEQNTLSFIWTQTAGPVLSLSVVDSDALSFVTPSVTSDTTFGFTLEVSDGYLQDSVTFELVVNGAQATPSPEPTPEVTNQQSGGGGINWLFLGALVLGALYRQLKYKGLLV